MSKLVAATLFAAVALAAQSTAACDWNREASAARQQVATTATPTQQSQATATAPQTASAAVESSKPFEPTAPVVPVNDHH